MNGRTAELHVQIALALLHSTGLCLAFSMHQGGAQWSPTSANCCEIPEGDNATNATVNDLMHAVLQPPNSRISPWRDSNTCVEGLQNTVIWRRRIDRQKDRA